MGFVRPEHDLTLEFLVISHALKLIKSERGECLARRKMATKAKKVPALRIGCSLPLCWARARLRNF